ncbi:hypothetical protein, partial [Burkholderia sp. LMG 13014]
AHESGAGCPVGDAFRGENAKAAVSCETAAFALGGESGMFFRFDKASFSVKNLAPKKGRQFIKKRTRMASRVPPVDNLFEEIEVEDFGVGVIIVTVRNSDLG